MKAALASLFSILLVGCASSNASSRAAVSAVITDVPAERLRIVPEMPAPAEPTGRIAYDDDVLRPCVKGKPETEAARAAVDALGERVAALGIAADPKPITDEVRRLLATECFQFSSWESFAPVTFASALAAKAWWTAGGEEWLRSYVDLETDRRIVVPPSPRAALALDLGDGKKSPIAPLLCPAGSTTCGQETVGWIRRFDAELDRAAAVRSRKSDDECLEAAKKLEGTARFDSFYECVAGDVPGRSALPLGRFQAPKDGWLVATGGAGYRCKSLRAYDLATGAAYIVNDCGNATTTKIGRVPLAALREAAWMLALEPTAEVDVRVASMSFDVPEAIAIERPTNGGRGRSISLRCGGVTSGVRHWSWMRGRGTLTGQTSGIVRWPGGRGDAEAHATELFAIAEDGFEEGCAPAPPPGSIAWTSPGPTANGRGAPAALDDPATIAMATHIGKARPTICRGLP